MPATRACRATNPQVQGIGPVPHPQVTVPDRHLVVVDAFGVAVSPLQIEPVKLSDLPLADDPAA